MGNSIIQFKIYLKGINPQIWRRFLVSDFWTFDKLHRIIQKVMGWENYHLYEFDVNGTKIGLVDDDALNVNPDLKNAKRVRLFEYLDSEGQRFSYLYDFGDNWEHEIIIEKMTEDKIEDSHKYPKCIDGKRACPPEDCRGVRGYEELLEIQKNKNHPRYKELIVSWLGENFDFEEFGVGEVNKRL